MTEQELRRTAVIIPPTGRAVLCVWAAVPGLFAAPFVFWQSIVAGAGFCLLWGFLVYCLWARACSFAAVLGERTVTVYSGVALPVRQVLRRLAAHRGSPGREALSARHPGPAGRASGPHSGGGCTMTRQRHYHPLAALHFLRKAVVVCLLPLANALLEFSLNALLTALRQDAALLLFLCGASSILLAGAHHPGRSSGRTDH